MKRILLMAKHCIKLDMGMVQKDEKWARETQQGIGLRDYGDKKKKQTETKAWR